MEEKNKHPPEYQLVRPLDTPLMKHEEKFRGQKMNTGPNLGPGVISINIACYDK